MPDAGASRKRQIQITPRPFGGADAFRLRLTNGRYPVSRVYARLSGLGGLDDAQTGSAIGTACARPDLAYGGVSPCVCPTRRYRNRVKLIRCRRRTDSIPGAITVPGRRAQAPGPALLHRCISARENGLPTTFRRFLPCSGAPGGGETPSRLPRMRCASSVVSIIGVKSAAADSATSPSIRRQTGVPEGASGLLRCVHRQLRRQ